KPDASVVVNAPAPHGSCGAGRTTVSCLGHYYRTSLSPGLSTSFYKPAMTRRRTKIVATLGPASSSAEKIEQLVIAGMDVARLNFSHGQPEDHRERVALVRQIAERHG